MSGDLKGWTTRDAERLVQRILTAMAAQSPEVQEAMRRYISEEQKAIRLNAIDGTDRWLVSLGGVPLVEVRLADLRGN